MNLTKGKEKMTETQIDIINDILDMWLAVSAVGIFILLG